MNQTARTRAIAVSIQLASRDRAAMVSQAEFIRAVKQYSGRTAPNATEKEILGVMSMPVAEAFGAPKQ